MKKCSKCGQCKPLEEFHRHRSSPSGRDSWCKVCRNAKGKSDRERDKRNGMRRYAPDFATAVRAAREAQGVSVNQLAALVGCSHGVITSIESKKHDVGRTMCRHIVSTLKLPPRVMMLP